MAQGQLPPVGSDVSSLMPAVGEDVTSLMGGAESSPEAKQLASLPSRVGSALNRNFNPVPLVKALADYDETVPASERALLTGIGLPPGAGNVVRGIAQTQAGEFAKAKEAYGKGEIGNAIMYGLSGAIPIAGPMLTGAAERIKSGDIAGGMIDVAAPLVPLKVPKAGTLTARAGQLAERAAPGVAASLERAATRRMVDVMAAKGSSAKAQRMGALAEKVAPTLLRDPELAAASRNQLHDKLKVRLKEYGEKYDEIDASKNQAEIFDPGPLKAHLQMKLNKLTAEAASGPEVHAQLEKLGLKPEAAEVSPLEPEVPFELPAEPPVANVPFSELPQPYKNELRRMHAELEEFPFQPGRKSAQEGETRVEAGMNVSRASRIAKSKLGGREAASVILPPEYIQAEAGAPVYHDILEGKTGTTRRAMIKSLGRYIDGEQKATPIVQRGLNVAHERLAEAAGLRETRYDGGGFTGGPTVSKPMLPEDAGFNPLDVEPPKAARAPKEEDLSKPIGVNVIAPADEIRAAVIQGAIDRLDKLGPGVRRDALGILRKGYGKDAEKVFNRFEPEYDAKVAKAQGAADVYDVFREFATHTDPEAAAINPGFSLTKNAEKVLYYTKGIERVRPRGLRRMVARGVGGWLGGKMVGGKVIGTLVGMIVGPALETVATSGPTTKIATARLLARTADAIKAGNLDVALTSLRQIAVLSGQTPKFNALLKQQQEKQD